MHSKEKARPGTLSSFFFNIILLHLKVKVNIDIVKVRFRVYSIKNRLTIFPCIL